MVKELRKAKDVTPKIAVEKNMRSLRLHGFKTKPEKDHLAARKTMLVNSDCGHRARRTAGQERGLLLQERRLR
jgi:hypothetical protein